MSAAAVGQSSGRDVEELKRGLPAGMRLVTEPIVLRRTRAGGQYKNTLKFILTLKRTSEDTGLSPHWEWSFDTKQEMFKAHGGLVAARRRLVEGGEKAYDRVGLMRQTNADEKKYIIYLWHQA